MEIKKESSKSKFSHWRLPNSRAHKRLQRDGLAPPGRKTRVHYQVHENKRLLCFKLLDKIERNLKRGLPERVSLTYEQLANDLSILAKRSVSVRQAKDYVAELRRQGAIKTTRKSQRSDVVYFDVPDMAYLISIKDFHDSTVHDNAPAVYRLKPVDKQDCDTSNVSHDTSNVSQRYFKRATIYLKKSLKKNLKNINQDMRYDSSEDYVFDNDTRAIYKQREQNQMAEYLKLRQSGAMRCQQISQPEYYVPSDEPRISDEQLAVNRLRIKEIMGGLLGTA